MLKIISLAAVLFIASSAYAGDNCAAFTNNAIKRAVDILHNKQITLAQKRQQLSVLFDEAVDTDWIGKFVLGRFWPRASAEQQKEYLSAYRDYLGFSFLSKFDEDDADNVTGIEVASITPQADGEVEVATLVKSRDDDDVHVNYVLDQSSGKCRVHDVSIENVSLITSQRSEFSELAKTSGVQAVTDAMKKRLANKRY